MASDTPYDDHGPWGRVWIGDTQLPGIVRSVDGVEKPEEWAVQKGTSGNNAATIWRGTKLAEEIKINLSLPTSAAFAAYLAAASVLRPKIGEKPPSFAIVNRLFSFAGVTRVSIRLVGTPRWNDGGGYWDADLTLIEYNPAKPAKAGPASPAGAAGAPGGTASGTQQTAAEKQRDRLLEEASKL